MIIGCVSEVKFLSAFSANFDSCVPFLGDLINWVFQFVTKFG